MHETLVSGFSIAQLALPALLLGAVCMAMLLPSTRERLSIMSSSLREYFYGPDEASSSQETADTAETASAKEKTPDEVADMLGFSFDEFSKRFGSQ